MNKVISVLLLISLSLSFNLKTDLKTPQFNFELSKTYVAYGMLAYCNSQCISNWSCDYSKNFPKLIDPTYIDNTITKATGYIGYQPISKAIIIGWRGSSNIQNWIQDFTFNMLPFTANQCSNCWIHAGFNQDYVLNSKKVNDKIQDLKKKYQPQQIVIVGHSLGGALASVNAAYLIGGGQKLPVWVYNMGSPRIGNKALSNYIYKGLAGHFRIVHKKDIVAHLPPDVQYHHVANQIFFDNDDFKTYKVCNDQGQDQTCSNKYFPNYNANDHAFYYVPSSQIHC